MRLTTCYKDFTDEVAGCQIDLEPGLYGPYDTLKFVTIYSLHL
jgi:hypothetical protein